MHIYSICKMKRVRFSVHGVQLNKVITQRVVIFSSPDMKDAHDHRPILNTVTRFFEHRVLHCDTGAEEMDDGRLPRNQALTFHGRRRRGDQLGYAPLPFLPCRRAGGSVDAL